MSAQPPYKIFEEVSDLITESRAMLLSGEMIELAGLDERVNNLCEAILALTEEERTLYADKLQYLMVELQTLGDTLKAGKDKLGEEILDIPSHRKATVAYLTVDASDGKKKDGN